MKAGIALGSNVGDRLAHLRAARTATSALSTAPAAVRASSVYETEPVGTNAGDEAFLNAVVEIEYAHPAATLLAALQAIEAQLGRPSKRPRNAPRTIDLDLLFLGNLTLSNADVVIPHPRLHLRRFVLTPLAELRPELILPGQERSVADLLAALSDPAKVALFCHDWTA